MNLPAPPGSESNICTTSGINRYVLRRARHVTLGYQSHEKAADNYNSKESDKPFEYERPRIFGIDNPVAFSPHANYTDRAKLVPTLAGRWVSSDQRNEPQRPLISVFYTVAATLSLK
jgi:hypothetical protein